RACGAVSAGTAPPPAAEPNPAPGRGGNPLARWGTYPQRVELPHRPRHDGAVSSEERGDHMSRALRALCLVGVLALIASACGGNGASTPPAGTGPSGGGTIQPGGTLNLAATGD